MVTEWDVQRLSGVLERFVVSQHADNCDGYVDDAD